MYLLALISHFGNVKEIGCEPRDLQDCFAHTP